MNDLVSGGVEVRLAPEVLRERLRRDVMTGLASSPKSVPSTWFYDETGSNLFDEITRLDEYYQTRTERGLLADHASDIVSITGVRSVVELGAGTCEKTRVLLDALAGCGQLEAIVPVDISVEMLERTVAELCSEYPGAAVRGVVTDFDGAVMKLPDAPARLVAFLGGTIGNLRPDERAAFFQQLSAQLGDADWFLLGCDLIKNRRRLIAAYDDRRGVTAAFNRNMLSVINRQLDADFDVDAFAHVVCWDEEAAWIEMRLRSLKDQTITISSLDLEISFEEGEDLLTEISAKFTPEGIERELGSVGLVTHACWTDPDADFALVLARPGGQRTMEG